MLNSSDILFNLETAKTYAVDGRLEDWIKHFLLHSESPNPRLWDRIQERKGKWLGPLEVPVKTLTRYFTTDSLRVNELIGALRQSTEMPPLIVHSRIHLTEVDGISVLKHQLDIADGGHRHEAYVHQGCPTCWVLIEIRTEYDE